jgi:hypothetical protein
MPHNKPLDIETEVRDLAARRDIYSAICAYARSHDRLLAQEHSRAFHHGAHVDCGTMAGTAEEFLQYAQSFLKNIKSSHHLLGQFDIQVDGDTGKGEVYFLAQHRIIENGEEKDLLVAGRYIDRYECRDGVWKIADRRELFDWVRTDAASDHFLANLPPRSLGRRGHEDS